MFFLTTKKYISSFCKKFFDEILPFYPENIRNKVKLLTLKDIDLSFETSSNWFTQQVCKIYISNHIQSTFYVLLDVKNHFIRYVDERYFLNSKNKGFLYRESHGDNMLYYYHNCLQYFSQECPYKENVSRKYQTVTPFLFVTDLCKDLIKYIEMREGVSLKTFFLNKKLYTEFFFYEAYLLFSNKMNNYYEIIDRPLPFSTIGNCNPELNYNNYDSKKFILQDESIKMFAIHRFVIPQLSDEYKRNLLFFYSHFYKSDIIDFINRKIFSM